jgi:plasmid stabilization system protein ParE
MDGLKIIWTRTALSQRKSIFYYWNKRNGSNSYSKKLNHAIKERVTLLKTQPQIGKQTIISEVYSISMRHYSIFYKKSKSSVFIVSFWDNRQNPEKVLNYLKKS